ncbi:MAG TPA: type II secretion system F family protein [Vicinamibacterales bacterium]|nr:type II secretion system F family protein [Vicinamibacterales bacterium]
MDALLLISIAVIFVTVAAATAAGAWFLTDPQTVQRRLSGLAPASAVAASGISQSLVEEGLSPFAKRVRSWVPKSPKEMGRIERLMASAGYFGKLPALVFATVQLLLPVAVFALIMAYWRTGPSLLFAALIAMISYFIPNLWLGRAIEKRKREIRNGLPDAIDLMIVCVESGSGLDQAIAKVAEEIALPYPALARELVLISTETRAGRTRLDAFRNFAERTKVDDVQSLVAMLVQTDRFGTSIGQALRTHAETSRTKRRQRAEEKAAKLGVKLLFPLVFCLFPAFYVVVLGPSMVRIFRDLVWGGGIPGAGR